MPENTEAHLNPNDSVQYAAKKKQFTNSNQHYLSHHAVLPPYDLARIIDELNSKKDGRDSPYTGNRTPYYDPNDRVPSKPNQITMAEQR